MSKERREDLDERVRKQAGHLKYREQEQFRQWLVKVLREEDEAKTEDEDPS